MSSSLVSMVPGKSQPPFVNSVPSMPAMPGSISGPRPSMPSVSIEGSGMRRVDAMTSDSKTNQRITANISVAADRRRGPRTGTPIYAIGRNHLIFVQTDKMSAMHMPGYGSETSLQRHVAYTLSQMNAMQYMYRDVPRFQSAESIKSMFHLFGIVDNVQGSDTQSRAHLSQVAVVAILKGLSNPWNHWERFNPQHGTKLFLVLKYFLINSGPQYESGSMHDRALIDVAVDREKEAAKKEGSKYGPTIAAPPKGQKTFAKAAVAVPVGQPKINVVTIEPANSSFDADADARANAELDALADAQRAEKEEGEEEKSAVRGSTTPSAAGARTANMTASGDRHRKKKVQGVKRANTQAKKEHKLRVKNGRFKRPAATATGNSAAAAAATEDDSAAAAASGDDSDDDDDGSNSQTGDDESEISNDQWLEEFNAAAHSTAKSASTLSLDPIGDDQKIIARYRELTADKVNKRADGYWQWVAWAPHPSSGQVQPDSYDYTTETPDGNKVGDFEWVGTFMNKGAGGELNGSPAFMGKFTHPSNDQNFSENESRIQMCDILYKA